MTTGTIAMTTGRYVDDFGGPYFVRFTSATYLPEIEVEHSSVSGLSFPSSVTLSGGIRRVVSDQDFREFEQRFLGERQPAHDDRLQFTSICTDALWPDLSKRQEVKTGIARQLDRTVDQADFGIAGIGCGHNSRFALFMNRCHRSLLYKIQRFQRACHGFVKAWKATPEQAGS